MKTQITIRYLLSITVSLLVLCADSWAGQFFFDDFSDGDPADGSPVNWLPVTGTDGYGYTLTTEGLKLGGATAADKDGTPYIYRNVSVRAQIKRTSNHTDGNWVSGLTARWNDGGPGGYWIEVRPSNRFWLGHRNRYVLRTASLPFNVDEKEFIIRVDTVDDQINCWCWPADEPMPDEPQITLVEDVVPDGVFSLYAGTGGGQAIYRWAEVVSTDAPIVDFNGDGKVDINDLLKMINSWNQDEPSVDINCDGTVDDKDLEILMEHWDQNVDDPTLLAHWALDETEGLIAYDSAGTNDAFLNGDPVWQPTMGQLGGALELDGDEDCIITVSVLNPADGPFSVIAWVKGGAPGQVILSQSNDSNWLRADVDLGCVTSELACQGRSPIPLLSQTVITDGEWHRIGLVYDGSNRTLYVDDVIAAQDTQTGLKDSTNGLYIGTDKAMEAGTFWSGLIDDVRIYKRAVSP